MCGLYVVVLHGFLIAVASLVAEHRLWGTWASVLMVHSLSCHPAYVFLVPGPGIKLVSPALAGGFLAAVPPRKSSPLFKNFSGHAAQLA